MHAIATPTARRSDRRRRPAVLAAGLALSLALVCGVPAPASADVVGLPDPCPQILAGGDGAIFSFCKALDRTRRVANVQYARHYSPAKQVLIRRAVTSLANRDPQFAAQSAALRSRQLLAFRFNIPRLKNFAVRALKVVQKLAGGVARYVPQARVANCALFGLLNGAGTYFGGGATVRQVVAATVLGCIGVQFVPFKVKKP